MALVALICFAKQPAKEMLAGRPTSDLREQVEHSLLIVAVISFSFHFIGRISSDAIIGASIDKDTKLKLYYFFFAFYELVYVAAILKWHQYKNCMMAKYARYVCYLSAVMATILLTRYVDRAVFETNILDSVYGFLVAGVNVLTMLAIGAYPAYRLFRLIPDKKWV
ncbi:hypothetical protein HG263_21715 [Pseudoalteromonas sp. JBTF-M23]|uniref:Uncharacterized protein n=1 Tax=Pseudoalteromonas caenipelagi TaxID=2726988 RepID=A0A849VI79_9GAMM|nr:hypothetical protein [Pseudoalteromonas caenipelagi]NOU53122.1 hypothetical protein [Pseudoalteromonas caenipelagi]